MKITLTTLSYLLLGSGEGRATTDADITFHATGFPVVPGRRLKGLLRESMMEVLEMTGTPDTTAHETLERIFGRSGSDGQHGSLTLPTLYLQGWDKTLEELKQAKQAYPEVFHAENLRRHFTAEIPQTAVENGVAKDKSLRMYRVLKPGYCFEGEITQHTLNDADTTLLRQAASNLRAAGTRRNRGFGEIRLTLETNTSLAPTSVTTTSGECDYLHICIETLGPVLLGLNEGEKNTVFTHQHIPGSNVRGLMAGLLASQPETTKPAQQDDYFRNNILNGGLQFGPCYKDGAEPVPLHLQQEKGEKLADIKDVMAYPQVNKMRPVGGVGFIRNHILEKKKTATSFMFHNSRPDRNAGRSMERDAEQGIFYYESISENQKFEGTITGTAEVLRGLVKKTGTCFETRMGRSRSAQYGRVRVTLTPRKAATQETRSVSSSYYLSALSPMILLNEWGHPTPDSKALLSCLKNAGITSATVVNAIVNVRQVEMFNNIWQSKTGRYPAFDTGSVWKISISDAGEAGKLQSATASGLGEWTAMGFGRCKWMAADAFSTAIKQQAETLPPATQQQTTEKPPKLWQMQRPRYESNTLTTVWLTAARRSLRTYVRRDAIRAAKGKQVTNSLSSRILLKLAEISTLTGTEAKTRTWKEFIQHIKGRIAGKSLDDKNLLTELEQLTVVLPKGILELDKPPIPVEELAFLWWTTRFETMRKKKAEHETI